MSSKKFSGAIARQFFTWGYTCEFCGREIEKQDCLSASQGGTYKTTTWVTINRAGAETMKQEALRQLLVSVAQMDEKVKSGKFEPPKGEEGRCPHCKKYQHWSQIAKNASHGIDNKAGNGLIVGCLTAALGPIIGMLLVLILPLNIKELPSNTKNIAMVAGVLFGILITWILARVFVKWMNARDKATDAKILKELEGVEKTEPRFIAWAEQTCDIYGLSVQ